MEAFMAAKNTHTAELEVIIYCTNMLCMLGHKLFMQTAEVYFSCKKSVGTNNAAADF